MAPVNDSDNGVMRSIDRLVNSAMADHWNIDKQIKRLQTLTSTPMSSERTLRTAQASHLLMITDTQKCGNAAVEAKDQIAYLSEDFPLAKLEEINGKIAAMALKVNKILTESVAANLDFEEKEEVFLVEMEKKEESRRVAAKERRQVEDAAAAL